MEQCHTVLGFWVLADADASMLRRMGLLRFWMPHRYRVNEVPSGSNVQQGMIRPSENHRTAGVRTAVEVLDYIGDQLLRAKDTEGAIYAPGCFGAWRSAILKSTRSNWFARRRAGAVGECSWFCGQRFIAAARRELVA